MPKPLLHHISTSRTERSFGRRNRLSGLNPALRVLEGKASVELFGVFEPSFRRLGEGLFRYWRSGFPAQCTRQIGGVDLGLGDLVQSSVWKLLGGTGTTALWRLCIVVLDRLRRRVTALHRENEVFRTALCRTSRAQYFPLRHVGSSSPRHRRIRAVPLVDGSQASFASVGCVGEWVGLGGGHADGVDQGDLWLGRGLGGRHGPGSSAYTGGSSGRTGGDCW